MIVYGSHYETYLLNNVKGSFSFYTLQQKEMNAHICPSFVKEMQQRQCMNETIVFANWSNSSLLPLKLQLRYCQGTYRQCNIRLLRLNLSLWVKLNCEAKGRKSKKPFNNIQLQRRQSDQLFGYFLRDINEIFCNKSSPKI